MESHNRELFLSLDIETDGPIPGKFSMMSFGVVAAYANGYVDSKFEAVLFPLPDAEEDYETMKFWAKFPEAYKHSTTGQVHPQDAMIAFKEWVGDIPGRRVPLAAPAVFDYQFFYWYMVQFLGDDKPLSFNCLDLRSYMYAKRSNSTYRRSGKASWPGRYFNEELKHTHCPVDDAAGQLYSFLAMHNEVRGTEFDRELFLSSYKDSELVRPR